MRDLLTREIEESWSKKMFKEGNVYDIYSGGPKPRFDTSNTANIMTGSDEIAVGAILSQCAKFSKYKNMVTSEWSFLPV